MSWISVEDKRPLNNQKVIVRVWSNNLEKDVEIEATFRLYDIDDKTEAWGWNIGKRDDVTARPTHWRPNE